MVKKGNRRNQILIQTILLLAILVFVNLLGQKIYTYLDLTEDKRFTLTNSTEKLLGEVKEVVYIDVLLGGDLPAGFKRLQNRTKEILRQFNAINPNIEFEFRDPSNGTTDEMNRLRENLSKDGIYPTKLTVVEDDEQVNKLIYPHALLQYGPRKLPINLLETGERQESPEVILNRSANALEYKFANAIAKLFKEDVPIVLFTKGNKSLLPVQTLSLETELRNTMKTGHIDLDSVYQIDPSVDVLVVTRPLDPLSEKHKFIIDQYLMNGGKVVWVIEQFHVNIDSINNNTVYIPKTVEHGLDDLFFKYGVRFKNDLILDLENSKIPQVVGRMGDQVQQELFPWVYYPLAQSSGQHPIVASLDRVYTNFPSSIELLKDNSGRKKTTLINSSRYSRIQVYPMRLSFEVIKLPQKPEKYNKPFLPIAVMVEGEFESFYKNRVSETMLGGLKKIGAEFKEKSPNTSQVFISDAEIIKNIYKASTQEIEPMGLNRWEQNVYNGNREFMVNLIDYLTDDYGLIESRSKNIQLRMLNNVKLQAEKLKWQLINIALPIVLIVLGGILFNLLRKRRYSN